MKILQLINSNDLFIYLMELKDSNLSLYTNFLNEDEKARLETFKSVSRQLEFAAARYLKHHVLNGIETTLDETGAPQMPDGTFISFSHSKKFVALMHSLTSKCAIDIEEKSPKALRLASKFVTESEHAFCRTENDATLIWSFKETLYKLSDRKGLDFKTDIRLLSSKPWIGEVSLKNGKAHAQLNVLEYEDHFITFNHSYTKLNDTTR